MIFGDSVIVMIMMITMVLMITLSMMIDNDNNNYVYNDDNICNDN